MNAIPRPAFLILNLAAYQAGWLACVWSASAGRPGWGVFAAAGFLGLHLAQSNGPGRDLRLAAVFIGVGLVVDSALGVMGVFRFAEPAALHWMAPPWLLAIWGLFAITIHASLGWLAGRPWLSALLGAVAGPLAYWAGARLGAVTLGIALPGALAVLAAVWAAVLPVLVWLAHRPGFPAYTGPTASVSNRPAPRPPARSLQAFLLVCVFAYVALLGMLWWAGVREPGFAGFAPVLESVWGWATLLDLYLGFAMIAVWMVASSERRWIGLLWAVALLVLGNLVALAFLLRRGGGADSWRTLLLGRLR